MGIGLDRAEIVDPDHFDILAAGFRNRPQDIAADAAKSVDRYADCHARFSLNSWRDPRGLVPRRCLRRIARFGRARTVKMSFYVVPFADNLNRHPKRFRAALTAAS